MTHSLLDDPFAMSKFTGPDDPLLRPYPTRSQAVSVAPAKRQETTPTREETSPVPQQTAQQKMIAQRDKIMRERGCTAQEAIAILRQTDPELVEQACNQATQSAKHPSLR